jgi:hypothetical protein
MRNVSGTHFRHFLQDLVHSESESDAERKQDATKLKKALSGNNPTDHKPNPSKLTLSEGRISNNVSGKTLSANTDRLSTGGRTYPIQWKIS